MDIFDHAQALEQKQRQQALDNRVKLTGKSLSHCKECGEAIPEARQKAYAGVQYCIGCQSERER